MILFERDDTIVVEALVVEALVVEALVVDAGAFGDEAPCAVDALVVDTGFDGERSSVDDLEIIDVEIVEHERPVRGSRGGAAHAVATQPQPRIRPRPETDAEPERHLRVAPDSYKRRRRVRIAAAAAGISISATLFAVVGFNVVLAQHQIELQGLQKKLQIEQSRYYDLREQVAQGSSPQHIVSEASRDGLVNAPVTYLPAQINPPTVGPNDTADTLRKTSRATEASLDHPVP